MAGGEPLKNAPVENCRNIAFSFLTGAADAGFYRNKLTTYTKNEFERLKKCGVMVRAENQPSKVDFINNAIFQFPQDNEIEV